MDLSELAENRLDAMMAEEANDTPPQDPPADDVENPDDQPPVDQPADDDTNPNGDDPNDPEPEDSEEDEPVQDPAEEEDEGEKPDPEQPDPKGKETQELTDEEFLKEAEKRGFAKAEAEKKQQQPAQTIQRPDEVPDKVWGDMNPAQQYVYQNLPYITVQGKDGNEIQIKTDKQLPKGFEFADASAQASFNSEIAAQSLKAEKMYAEVTGYIERSQRQQESQQQSQRVIGDIERLQKDNLMPKITAEYGSKEFETDPGVQLANEILAYRDKLIDEGENISAYNAGLAYRALHPEKFAPPAPKTSPADAERKKAAKNIAGNGRGSQSSAVNKDNKPARVKFAPGVPLTDISDYYADQLD